jgi:4-amino-4-deoxy-L-arabinose transferase-like glycosyltransferase
MENNRRYTIRRWQSPVVWFLVVCVVAFLLRLIHLLQLRQSDPLFLSPQMDSLYHHEWALAIAAGREFIADAFFRAPLYPYFLGLLYKLFGANLLVVRMIQSIIGSAGCGLVYLLARQLLPPQAASPRPPKSGPHSSLLTPHSSSVPVIAGLVMAVYPLAVWFDGELLLEGLLTFLVLLGFVLLLRSRESDRQWWLPGIVFGLAAITRPNVLAFLAVLPVWLFLDRSRTCPTVTTRRTVLVRLVQIWGAAALVILPVTIRNYVVSRQFVPIAWQAGTNFYIGNSPVSDGVTAIVPGTRGSWWGGYDDVRRLAEEALGRPLKGAEIDRYWLGRGFEFWREQPGKALGLLARKAFLWFAGYEVSNDRDLYTVKRYSFINYLLYSSRFLKFPFGIVLPLALAGVWLLRREWRRLLPVYLLAGAYSVSFIVFFVCSRYRMPLVPIAAVLGSAGLLGLMGRVGRMSGRGVALAIAVAAFLLFNANLAGAGGQVSADQNHVAAAVGLHEQGRDSAALIEVREALESDSTRSALSLEAALLSNLGDFAGAERAARAVVRRYPDDADAYDALAGVLATAGQLESAAVYFEIERSLAPYSIHAWNSLGNIALSRRDLVRARDYYEGALNIRPMFAPAMFGLGLCDYHEGKLAEARARWQEILRIDPTFTRARQALEQMK